jgi:phosphoglycerate dehydrogenase-like enzyme
MENLKPRKLTVISTLTWPEEELALVREAFEPAEFIQCGLGNEDSFPRALQRAHVALLSGDRNDAILNAPQIGWVHCDHAGLNSSAKPELFAKGIIATGSAGRSAPALAEHGFFFALAFTYDIRSTLSRQAGHRWEGDVELRERGALWGQRLGILGFGHTGREMAKLGRAFGMHVTVLRRKVGETSTDVDVALSVDAGDSINDLLESDVLMLAAGLSDESYHILGAEQLRRMKKTAIVINLGRGSLIDEEALVQALKAGEIAGAGLDVVEQEPLPSDSPLWDMPNVLITPHATPQVPDKTQRSRKVVVENIKRYRAGQPMLNAIKQRDAYTKGQ